MSKPRILIVEDENLVAIDIEEALISLNYNVIGIASTGQEALELVEERKPDLVLMDIHLGAGGMDGVDTSAKIREQHDTPVIFLTAFADKATLNRAKIVEPYGYVLKPFRYPELRTAIELALHKHAVDRERQALSAAAPTNGSAPLVPDFSKLVQSSTVPNKAMQATILNFLEKISPFSKLSAEILTSISAVCLIRSYKNHEMIFSEGAERETGFLVVSGRVAINKTSPGGKELIVELVGPGNLFGVLTLLDRSPFPFSARAQGETRLLWVPREFILHLSTHYPEISREMFERVLSRLRKAHDLARALAHDKVEVRIASALSAIVGTFGEDVADKNGVRQCELTRQELGELVGTTPETVSRILNRLEAEGVVDLSSTGIVRVLKQEGLTGLEG